MNECLNRIGNLEKNVSSLDARVDKLETVIEKRFQHFEKHLEKMETSLTAKLDKIDEDIRGNGKDSINLRLDHLENSKKTDEPLVLGYCRERPLPLLLASIFLGREFRSIEENEPARNGGHAKAGRFGVCRVGCD